MEGVRGSLGVEVGEVPASVFTGTTGDVLVFLVVGVLAAAGLLLQFDMALELYGNEGDPTPPVNCEACGAPNDPDARECDHCGEPLTRPSDS